MSNDSSTDSSFRRFIKVPGNEVGIAMSAGRAYVCIGIRMESGQGDILIFEAEDDLNTFIAHLLDASEVAFIKE